MSYTATGCRRIAFGLFAASAACAAFALPAASADPDGSPAPPAQPVDDCNAATLAKTISSMSPTDALTVLADV